MKAKRLVVVIGLAGAFACGSAMAKSGPTPTGNGIEVPGTATWPTVAVALAKNVARASFAHDSTRVWSYLHPIYQKGVSQTRWRTCQRAHPSLPQNVKVRQIAIAQASSFPVGLPLLGRKNVQEIQLLVRFTTPGVRSVQSAILYTFWLRDGRVWRAVWLSDEYRAYKDGRCYVTPQGPPLY